MASAEFDEAAEEKRPTVQVGDPFLEKLLLEACLELMATDALVAIQDMGAAGLTCATSEMAARGRKGIEIDLDEVPQRERGMTPYEILLSESQERMLLVARAGREAEVESIFHKWDLDACAIGKVTADGKLRVHSRGRVVAEVPAVALADEGPVYERPLARPGYLDRLADVRIDDLAEPRDLEATLVRMLESHTLASKHWIFEQYDHMVRSNTIVLPGGDAGVVRLKGTPLALAMCLDGNGRYAYLDPYLGGAAAIAEGCRNLAAVGAAPIGATNCLNFGNPEKPETMWQFSQVIDGMRDACQHFQVPITGGNVSFYNETEGEGIYPTPVVGLVGLLEDRKLLVTHHFKEKGDLIFLLGETAEEIGGSEYLKAIHGRIDGKLPKLDLDVESAVQDLVRAAASRGLLRSAHDLSDGGLGVALAECLLGPLGETMGAAVSLETRRRADAVLFSESQSRILISVPPAQAGELERLADDRGVPLSRLGVTGGDTLEVRVNGERAITRPVGSLREAWWSSIERGLES
jgi:phosphoribosylformylglycinamidine synthase